MFSIHQSSGVVMLERSLDFETTRQHTISILVQVNLQYVYIRNYLVVSTVSVDA